MAQWSHATRTLFAKLVYYGPAFGGKTTNLRSLHCITDPSGTSELLTVRTGDDRTLFFDLLPFELGEILGYRVALKVYTVPGQVRYETSRQVVLGNADAVVFVADSNPGREEQNRWSLQNLQMNMRACSLDPATVPVIFQFNKQDLPEAAPAAEVARWLRIDPTRGVEAVATRHRGVVETFLLACRSTLDRIVSGADARTLARIDTAGIAERIEEAFAPHLCRAGELHAAGDRVGEEGSALVLDGDNPLPSAIETGMRLGEQLAASRSSSEADQRQLAEAHQRLEAEESLGRSIDDFSRRAHPALASILSNAVCLRARRCSAGERTELADSIVQAGESLEATIREILDRGGSGEGGGLERPQSDTTVGELARRTLLCCGEPPVRVKLDDEAAPLRLELEPVVDTLAGLIDNALAVSPEAKSVQLVMRRCGDGEHGTLVISIFDRGPGVTQEQRDGIFSPPPVRPPGPTELPATGRSLWEARALAHRLGGGLVCLPRKGGGSEFRMHLPRALQAEAVAEGCSA